MSNKKLHPPSILPPSFTASSKFCLFHKGDLSEDIYTCPKCKIIYCPECVKKLRLIGNRVLNVNRSFYSSYCK